MNILAIDTSSDRMVVALSVGEELFWRVGEDGAKKHNSQIIPTIEEVLESGGISVGDIDYFACVVGPGSFTGIRIGVSCVKALAFACGKKCVAISAFEELAYGVNDSDFYVCIDCGHGSFYYAKFKEGYLDLVEMGEMTVEDAEKKNRVIIKSAQSDPTRLITIAKRKIADFDFSDLMPMYLKKSQAEREYEQNHMDKTV